MIFGEARPGTQTAALRASVRRHRSRLVRGGFVDPTEARWASLAQSDLNSLDAVLALGLPMWWSRQARGDKILLEFIFAGQ